MERKIDQKAIQGLPEFEIINDLCLGFFVQASDNKWPEETLERVVKKVTKVFGDPIAKPLLRYILRLGEYCSVKIIYQDDVDKCARYTGVEDLCQRPNALILAPKSEYAAVVLQHKPAAKVEVYIWKL